MVAFDRRLFAIKYQLDPRLDIKYVNTVIIYSFAITMTNGDTRECCRDCLGREILNFKKRKKQMRNDLFVHNIQ
jgi:hypothetical protein